MGPVVVTIGFVLLIAAIMVVTWRMARVRGFNPWCWFLSGFVGAIVLYFIPSPAKANTPEEAERRAQLGNKVGVVLTVLIVGLRVFGQLVRHH